jgi:hypothetical protein
MGRSRSPRNNLHHLAEAGRFLLILHKLAFTSLPNPGGDLTYPLQFAPGALINTAGSGNDFVGGTNGYGNVQFNGLPALSNGYIVDGLETNDPLTNLNSGLSTNLVLGLNSIWEVIQPRPSAGNGAYR